MIGHSDNRVPQRPVLACLHTKGRVLRHIGYQTIDCLKFRIAPTVVIFTMDVQRGGDCGIGLNGSGAGAGTWGVLSPTRRLGLDRAGCPGSRPDAPAAPAPGRGPPAWSTPRRA